MNKYTKGEKIVLRKDLVVGSEYGRFEWGSKKNEDLSKLDYVEILNVCSDGNYEVTTGWCVSDEMIEGLYEEPSVKTDNTSSEDDAKYLWMSDAFEQYDCKKVIFIGNNHATETFIEGSSMHKRVLKGDYPDVLLNESEAMKHYLFKATHKIEVKKEELYYVRLNGSLTEDGYLNHNQSNGSYFMSDCDEEAGFKTKFTEEECDKIIGTSEILYKELVK